MALYQVNCLYLITFKRTKVTKLGTLGDRAGTVSGLLFLFGRSNVKVTGVEFVVAGCVRSVTRA